MSRFVSDYSQIPQQQDVGGRLDAPTFHRNHDPIWSAIGSWLTQQDGDALEIGSGTGQHIVEFARKAPRLTWWPSDILDAHLRSIEAWSAEAALRNLRRPQILDLTATAWQPSGPEGALTAIICINVLHIAPWRVSEHLLSGAARLLRPGGRLFVYGPFMRDGVHTAPSNASFDEKKSKLQNTHFELSRGLLHYGQWGANEIEARGKALAERALVRWRLE